MRKGVPKISIRTGFIWILALMTVSCSSEKNGAEDHAASEIEYVRPGMKDGNSAAYFSYTNPLQIADTLQSVKADEVSVSQVHESIKLEDGMMGMKEQKQVIIKAGDKITFRPGGLHIMLMGLEREFGMGDTVNIQMFLKQAGTVSFRLPVSEQSLH